MFWNKLFKGLGGLFGSGEIDEDFYEELEETLIMADVGMDTTMAVTDRLRQIVRDEKIKTTEECKSALMRCIAEEMGEFEDLYAFEDQKSVVLVIGVNGAGKTTTIGKLASIYKDMGRSVLIAGADTFRAAASTQLKVWAERSDVPYVIGNEGSDPASVLYDAIASAKAKDIDILLCDTAGRLHNKKNLMQELTKLKNVIAKEYAGSHIETLLVLDASTGQNALSQAKQFLDSVGNIDGIILTKLDGTAKGGITIAIESELKIPVKYTGVGERIEDLKKFDRDEFLNEILNESGSN